MPYRGDTRTTSNRYFFNGPSTFTSGQFTTMADWLVDEEKVLISTSSSAQITEAIHYDAGSDVPVATRTYTQAGTASSPGGTTAPGDCANLVRFSTTQRTSKNHPIYLFKYWKPARCAVSENGADAVPSAFVTLLQTYGNDLVAGHSDGTQTRKLCGPYGAVAQGAFVETEITHRDFPR
jgi:hypothetical protein